jgi:hypothetical protein
LGHSFKFTIWRTVVMDNNNATHDGPGISSSFYKTYLSNCILELIVSL